MKRRIRNGLMLLMASVLIGTLLLTLSFCLPVNSARAHVEESLYNMIEVSYDESGSQFRKDIIGRKDQFTDCLMVQNALERVAGESALSHAMNVFHYDLGDDTTWITEESLITFLREGIEGMNLKEYSKYWHGYLIWLKPLLMCMSWQSVETVWLVSQILLLVGVLGLSFYQKKPLLGIGVIVTFLFMKPLSVWYSLTLSCCWTIVLVALLVELLFHKGIEQKCWREEYFLLIGIMTAFMDFLTYPIITLGVPLCFYLLQAEENTVHWWKRLRRIFWMVVCWCVGYIGMWGMKWVTAELTVQSGTLRNAIWSVIYRTGPLDGYGSVFTGSKRTLLAVLQQYDSVWYAIGFGIIAAMAVISSVWCFIKARNSTWAVTMLSLLAIALSPFVWMLLTQNHTAIHCFFTFRIMAVTVMSVWSMAVCSIRTIRNKSCPKIVREE